MPEVHSKLSPSAASRWLKCPGSLEGPSTPRQSSEYAAQGTVAHELAQRCWLLGVSPETFIGQSRSCDGHTVKIDQEMVDGVTVYLDAIEAAAGDVAVMSETRIEHSTIKGFGGTIDCVIPSKNHLIDLKFGAGLAVEVQDNKQLISYAILFRDHFKKSGDVKITIVQPRVKHPDGPVRSVTLTASELDKATDQIREVAEGKRQGEMNAGDHCRWCPRAADCPTLYELTVRTAKAEFADDSMSADRAAEVLGSMTAIKSYLDAVQAWVRDQLDKGSEVPGYKLVNTYHNRRYAVDEETIVRKCRNKKIGKKQIYETKLLSPAQLEKVAGKDLVAGLVERPHKGTTVVPVSDRREAVERSTPAEDFDECESE
ncbi:MAG: DUF2800 domain-containing protein [Planctomycetota bacterium]